MPAHRVINFIAIAAIVVDIIWFVLRVKKDGWGDKSDWNKSFLAKVISIYIVALMIVGLSFFITFGNLSDVVLNACAVLGIEIANKELLPKPIDKD